MNCKSTPWTLHILFGAIFTVIWGVWHGYHDSQCLVSLLLSTLASRAAARLIQYQYLSISKPLTPEKNGETAL